MRNFIISPNIVRGIKCQRLRWAGHVARIGEERSTLNMLTDESTGRSRLISPRGRWEDITVDLQEIGVNTRNWIDSAQDNDYWRALFKLLSALNLRVP